MLVIAFGFVSAIGGHLLLDHDITMMSIMGFAPLISSRSTRAQFLIPMAISLAFGVLVAALITLFVVPSGYLILEDLRGLPERLRKSVPRVRHKSASPVMPSR